MKINVSIKKIIIWIILSESMLILSTRLGTFLHEFVGHGLMASILGGNFEAFRLTLFAGGEAKFSGNFSKMAYLWISLGGIMVNLITGFVILLFIKKRGFSFTLILFGIFLAGVSILSQIQYMVLGAYYQYGDPVCLINYPAVLFLAWTGGLLLLAFFSWYLMRLFFQFQDAYFPVPHIIHRIIITLLILGIPIILYTCLYQYFKTPLGSTKAIQEARLHAYREAERIKAETKSKKSIEKIRKELEPHPILPMILAIYFLTMLLAFLQTNRTIEDKKFPPMPLSYSYSLSWGIFSGAVLSIIAFLW